MIDRPLLTVHETALHLKVKETTVRTWIREGRLRAIKFGREWRVVMSDLEHFVNAHANFPADQHATAGSIASDQHSAG